MTIAPLTEPRYFDRPALADALGRRMPAGRFEGLYVSGRLEGLRAPTVAVVGSRAPSELGRTCAFRLGAALGAAGVCVVSGLALGIDAAAHAGALEAGAATVGILGGGHRCFFPPRNAALAARIVAAGGAVISPYPPEHPALPHQFLERNGLVAGLADAVVVVEAAARSGALNTAGWAAQRGVAVLAFPGDVDRPKVAGCLALIRDGATLARNADDVLAALPGRLEDAESALPRPTERSPARTGNPIHAAVLRQAREGGVALDTLVERLREPPATIAAAVARLELDGLVTLRDGLVCTA